MGRYRVRAAALVAWALLAAASCSSGQGGNDAARYDGPGPFPVGRAEITLEGIDGGEGRATAWYPAEGTVAVATASAQVDADSRVADGPYPLVVFDHGLAASPEQYDRMLTHLALWGHLIVAPVQVSDSDPVDVAEAVRDRASEAAAGPLQGLVDDGPIVVVGHSAGTTYAARAAAESAAVDGGEVAGALLLAGGGQGAVGVAPVAPTLFLAGGRDPVTGQWMVPGFESAAGPAQLVVIDEAGHLSFTDLCSSATVTLGPANCTPDDIDEADVWPVIDHSVVAFVRAALGSDDGFDALDPGLLQELAPGALTSQGTLSASS
ncbi:MAG: hypothetical protein KDB35_19715 [Acidimicrobiales bacterium]|nr:hypothetical protein [Acidimicrobiales bacterium]